MFTEESTVSALPVADRFSGHESFSCRYGWLPKFYRFALSTPERVRVDEAVMVELGIGRNMVKSLRFWAQAFGLLSEPDRTGMAPTAFGRWLLDPQQGADPFLEDIGSVWLLHWRLCAFARLAAWDTVFFDTPEREVLKRSLITKLERRGADHKRLSDGTVRQHLDILLNSYAASSTAGQGALEDTLGCPLQELGIVQLELASEREPVVVLPRGAWPHLSNDVFVRVLLDYWALRAPNDRTLTLRALLSDFASPGLSLRLDEVALWDQLSRAVARFPTHLDLSDGLEQRSLVLRGESLQAIRTELDMP